MLSARRKSDGQTVTAYFELRDNGPYYCLDCGDRVVLRKGRNRANYFAHATPQACRFGEGESDFHRRCKMEIYEALLRHPSARNVVLERPLGTVRPDVSAYIKGVPVAFEVQVSTLSIEAIMYRTIEYARKGIYVLWLLQWIPELDSSRYTPEQWEKWVHIAYFGQAYYWLGGLEVASYSFEPYHQIVPRKSWYAENGKKMTGGGYSKRSKRYRTPIRGKTLDLIADFKPQERYWWEGGGFKVPDAKLYLGRN